MFVVIGILIGLGAGAALAFIALYALTGSRLAAARRTRQLLLTEARPKPDLPQVDSYVALADWPGQPPRPRLTLPQAVSAQ